MNLRDQILSMGTWLGYGKVLIGVKQYLTWTIGIPFIVHYCSTWYISYTIM